MGLILIYGRSGSGKSRSMKNLDRKRTLVLNVQGKAYPFREVFPYSRNLNTSANDPIEVIQKTIIGTLLKYPTVDTIVIDDAGYLMTRKFMAKHKQKTGSASFDLYNEIGDDFWNLFNFCNKLPLNVNTYMMLHEEQSDYGDVKLKTIGRLLDQKVCLEGMVTVCLRCVTDGKHHYFQTQNSGNDISKSPEDMFPEDKIENDLAYVDQIVRQYYGTDKKEENENA